MVNSIALLAQPARATCDFLSSSNRFVGVAVFAAVPSYADLHRRRSGKFSFIEKSVRLDSLHRCRRVCHTFLDARVKKRVSS